ncbi:unnamed protein product [Angiostrongylus costaricensis]|uniref:RING-type domain-containing protein n=1 Tax=Angiostrongylus costaricensis TaxID=334426 RepID=A0A0R3PH00_ANGCS|nr:unnamed protein product [Angiostrongylus costaricensis]
MLSCGHSFCAGCIQHWLSENISCPTCRTDTQVPIRNILKAHCNTHGIDLRDEAHQAFHPSNVGELAEELPVGIAALARYISRLPRVIVKARYAFIYLQRW